MRGARTLMLAAALIGLAACMEKTPTGDYSGDPAYRADASDPTPASITLERIGGFDHGGEAAAEITAFDDVSQRLFVVNGLLGTVDVLDLKDPSSPDKIATLPITAFGPSANSVAASNGVVAVAIQADDKTAPGTVAFYRAATLQLISTATVGALPDMVTFTPDGRTVLVANEGEPNDDYSVDPEGSIAIIDVTNINKPTVRIAGFGSFSVASLRAEGVRIFGPNNPTAAQDLEPEYVAASEDGATAYATLQENNALAIIDIASATVLDVVSFGFKDHSIPGNGLDPSNKDGPDIGTWPVHGMYQPDGIAAYTVGGETFLVTANEGDAREYDGFEEEADVEDLTLSASLLAACGAGCQDEDNLGKLKVTATLGENAGEYDELYSFGARSFSIWTASGSQVFDSGDDLEQITLSLVPGLFNASNEDPPEVDDRSDNKGPEPEGVVIGKLGSKSFAFIGLERVGGVMVYDVTNPFSPVFVDYVNTRTTNGDLGPEGILFVPANRSPNKHPLLIIGNEVSGTSTIFQVVLH